MAYQRSAAIPFSVFLLRLPSDQEPVRHFVDVDDVEKFSWLEPVNVIRIIPNNLINNVMSIVTKATRRAHVQSGARESVAVQFGAPRQRRSRTRSMPQTREYGGSTLPVSIIA